jgi:uncharacterized membrane protein HdeD (DUF308 family)
VFQTLIRNWWLLALCGVLEAVYAVLNLLMFNSEGSLELRRFAPAVTGVSLGKFAIAAGLCTVAAAFWNSARGRSWLLALNGVALSLFGALSVSWTNDRQRHGFLPVALLFIVMTTSLAGFTWSVAPELGRRVRDRWFLAVGGAGSVIFALTFIGWALRWIRFEQPGMYFLWISSYFAFSALCMLALGLRLNSLRTGVHRLAV